MALQITIPGDLADGTLLTASLQDLHAEQILPHQWLYPGSPVLSPEEFRALLRKKLGAFRASLVERITVKNIIQKQA
jgi:hypothetical protein